MANSMTGFGMGEYRNNNYIISVECKTINHKYLDINPRLPRNLSFLEDKLRVLTKNYVTRGRVDIFVKINVIGSLDINLIYDKELASQYFSILNLINKDFNLNAQILPTDIAKFTDVIKIDELEADKEKLWNMLRDALETALKNLSEMRHLEGKKMEQDILDKALILNEAILKIEDYSELVVLEYKKKLNTRIQELLEEPNIIDESRIAQEVAIYADKSDINEEIVRFKSHIVQLKETVIKAEPIGRKIDFLIQEMNREINTIGSKSPEIKITNLVIQLKAELEKIREQVQNIE